MDLCDELWRHPGWCDIITTYVMSYDVTQDDMIMWRHNHLTILVFHDAVIEKLQIILQYAN